MADRSPSWEPEAAQADQVAFRAYVASRLYDLAFAFSDCELLAESIEVSGGEGSAFRGYVAMQLDALLRAFEASDRLNRGRRDGANTERSESQTARGGQA